MSAIKFALNAIQWISIKEDPSDPTSADLWRYADPTFVNDYPAVLHEIKASGFDVAMMEVLSTQTLQSYSRMIQDADLEVAPGYLEVVVPSDYGQRLRRGTYEWAHWFDGARRRAEESQYMGLSTVFVASEMNQSPTGVRCTERAAVGWGFRQDRLEEFTEILGETCEVLRAEGIRPGLHNHVGTWVETEAEIEFVLGAIGENLLGASFDVGHLEWAGIDAVTLVKKYASRMVDLHVKDIDLDVARRSREQPTTFLETANARLFLEPGLGQIDLEGVLRALPADFSGWVIVEVDRASMDPDDSARVSAAWVKRMQQRVSA